MRLSLALGLDLRHRSTRLACDALHEGSGDSLQAVFRGYGADESDRLGSFRIDCLTTHQYGTGVFRADEAR